MSSHGQNYWVSCFQDDVRGSWGRLARNVAGESRLEMVHDDVSTGALFESLWGGEASTEKQPVSGVPLPESVGEMFVSEGEMAAWLYQIVKGEGAAGDQHDENGDNAGLSSARGEVQQEAPARDPPNEAETKLAKTEGKCTKGPICDTTERRKTTGVRRSQHGQSHSYKEKRRRCKINEKLRTLQQLVPGCDKSNQASTLDQTIQYMKSLQQQVQEFSVKPAMFATVLSCGQPVAVGARMPMILVRPGVALGLPMLPFGPPMLPSPRPVLVEASPFYPAPTSSTSKNS